MLRDGMLGLCAPALLSGCGERVGAGVDRRVGGKSVTGAPTYSWDDVREAHRYWAQQFRYRLCTEGRTTDCTPPAA